MTPADIETTLKERIITRYRYCAEWHELCTIRHQSYDAISNRVWGLVASHFIAYIVDAAFDFPEDAP